MNIPPFFSTYHLPQIGHKTALKNPGVCLTIHVIKFQAALGQWPEADKDKIQAADSSVYLHSCNAALELGRRVV